MMRTTMNDYGVGVQPCPRFSPEDDLFAGSGNAHECLAPFAEGPRCCAQRGTVSHCRNCRRDHHSGGYETCLGHRKEPIMQAKVAILLCLDAMRRPENGYHHCRSCSAGTANGWQHEVGCAYGLACRRIDAARAAAEAVLWGSGRVTVDEPTDGG